MHQVDVVPLGSSPLLTRSDNKNCCLSTLNYLSKQVQRTFIV